MTLSPLDDYPVHQAAQVIRHPATSDRNFYDRYYFNCHPGSDRLMLIVGLGQYPNLGVTDAFALASHGNTHRVVRASRPLGADRMDTTVGPFRVEVIEGLKRLRVVLEPNPHGLDVDLTWQGSIPAQLEPRHFMRMQERVIIDSARLAQTGRWSGLIRSGDQEFEVTPDRWQGAREQGVRVWPESAGRPTQPLGRPEYRPQYAPGTRDVVRATISFSPVGGNPIEVAVRPVRPVSLMTGTGYGLEPEWRHGMYQGPDLVVQGACYDLGKAEDRARMWGMVDSVAEFECAEDGGTVIGHGLFEYWALGEHAPTGLTAG